METTLVVAFDCDTDAESSELARQATDYLRGTASERIREHKHRKTTMSAVDAIRIVAEHPEALSIVASLIAYLVGRGSGKTKLTIIADGTIVADGITSNTAERAIKAHYENRDSHPRAAAQG